MKTPAMARRPFGHQQDEREQPDGDEAQREFVVVVQQERRYDADEQPADGSAGGDAEVERGQTAGGGPHPHQFAVADHADCGERREIDGEQRCDGHGNSALPGEHRCKRRHGAQRHPEAAPIPAIAVESEDEAEQVDDHRRDPEQRRRKDVLTEMVGNRQERHRRRRRQGEPKETLQRAIGFA
jgi:hypothetical protein